MRLSSDVAIDELATVNSENGSAWAARGSFRAPRLRAPCALGRSDADAQRLAGELSFAFGMALVFFLQTAVELTQLLSVDYCSFAVPAWNQEGQSDRLALLAVHLEGQP